ncbi:MAG: ethanolamine ammonia-lyase reactivating factor EutA, partial [Chloroflexi bacterium]|nr:ethanolamine ammonia-lyase reactivating factor EutA [Chloroflexota bacterium]
MADENQQEHNHSGVFMGLHSHEGGALHWHDEFGEHMAEDLSPEEFAARQLDWRKHNLQIVTVGVDIGSSTSHLMFSKIYLQLVGEAPRAYSVVVGREILWQSPIILTPYLPDNTIDVAVLKQFVANAYAEVGATSNEVDSGVIILTGEALKRQNARAIGEMFALETGKFVCAAAGHHLEAVLAANGSGTVARSRRDERTLLNIDIGGGTTKLAVVRDGEILATAAVAIGARLIVKDEAGRVTRLDEPARRVAERLGIHVTLGEPLAANDEKRIVQAWTDVLAGLIARKPPEGLAAELMLTEPLPADVEPHAITFSGGVSEFIYYRERRDFGDLGKPLARAIGTALGNGAITMPSIVDPSLGIRATAIGASLFSTQVGINLYISDEAMLPLVNVPVLMPKADLEGDIVPTDVAAAIRAAAVRVDFEEGEQPLALAFEWPNDLDLPSVRALAEGIRAALPLTLERSVPLALLVDFTIARDLGRILKEEMGIPGNVVSLEGVIVKEFDFVDLAPV